MREKTIEKKLVQAVKEAGGMAPKLSCPGMVGMPDRIVLLPMGNVAFVEVKRPGGKPRPLQVARIEALRLYPRLQGVRTGRRRADWRDNP
jgi:hypothetical protein